MHALSRMIANAGCQPDPPWRIQDGRVDTRPGFDRLTLTFSVCTRRNRDYRPLKLAVAGHMTVIMGILLLCTLCLAAIWLMRPGIFDSGSTEKLSDAAPQLGGKYHGLLLGLFIDALAGNAITGFFVAVVFSFSIVKKQEGSDTDENGLSSLQ